MDRVVSDMTLQQAIEILEQFNAWRRGSETVEITTPKKIGIALDILIENAINKIA